jgi:hypothetical protein
MTCHRRKFIGVENEEYINRELHVVCTLCGENGGTSVSSLYFSVFS